MGKPDYRKRLNKLSSQAQEQGWSVQQTEVGNFKFIPPEKDREIVIASGTAFDPRVADSVLFELRRSGFRDR